MLRSLSQRLRGLFHRSASTDLDRHRSPQPDAENIRESFRGQALFADKVVIFQHIAKTAGSTLNSVFSRVFPPDVRINALSRTVITPLGMTQNDEVVRTIRNHLAEGRTFKYLGGHVGFGIHIALGSGEARYLTVLRHPIERAASNFFYVTKLNLVEDIAPELPIESYLRDRSDYHLWFSNAQLRSFSDDPDVHPQQLPLTATTADVRPLTRADIKAVARNIADSYEIVGLSDRLDEFLVLFAGRYGAALSDLVYHDENVNTERPPLAAMPDELVFRIREANRGDLIIFRWVKRRFEAAVAAAGPKFQADVARFRQLNAAYRAGVPHAELGRVLAAWPVDLRP